MPAGCDSINPDIVCGIFGGGLTGDADGTAFGWEFLGSSIGYFKLIRKFFSAAANHIAANEAVLSELDNPFQKKKGHPFSLKED